MLLPVRSCASTTSPFPLKTPSNQNNGRSLKGRGDAVILHMKKISFVYTYL